MSVYNKLNVIDEFEAKFGNREAVRRACDLMVSYLSETATSLPEVAAQAVHVGRKYKNGLASRADLNAERKAISQFLSDHSAWTNYEDQEYCAVHAVHGFLDGYINLSWGGGASELVSNFWEMMEKFDRNEVLLQRLLQEHFSRKPSRAACVKRTSPVA